MIKLDIIEHKSTFDNLSEISLINQFDFIFWKYVKTKDFFE